MPTTQTLSRSPPASHPRMMSTGGKSPSKIPIAYPAPYKHVPSSTKHRASGSSANTSAVPSLVSDSGSGGSAAHDGGMSDVDLLDMLDLNLGSKVDPEPLDRGMVRQAKASGELRAKQRELEELQQMAQRRLKGARANFAEGAKAAKEVKRDLEWTQKKVNTLKTKTEKRYPKEYRKVHARYPSPEH